MPFSEARSRLGKSRAVPIGKTLPPILDNNQTDSRRYPDRQYCFFFSLKMHPAVHMAFRAVTMHVERGGGGSNVNSLALGLSSGGRTPWPLCDATFTQTHNSHTSAYTNATSFSPKSHPSPFWPPIHEKSQCPTPLPKAKEVQIPNGMLCQPPIDVGSLPTENQLK